MLLGSAEDSNFSLATVWGMAPVNLPKAARLALGELLDVAVELAGAGTREARFPLGFAESRLRKSPDGLEKS
ncbi:MAG: hypothetical protein DMF38_01095 [Verrucomicrobia bacterium]|nr:MAG: hypothetical protein DMF38_01095 [Verrucomicrobiota bacterium]